MSRLAVQIYAMCVYFGSSAILSVGKANCDHTLYIAILHCIVVSLKKRLVEIAILVPLCAFGKHGTDRVLLSRYLLCKLSQSC